MNRILLCCAIVVAGHCFPVKTDAAPAPWDIYVSPNGDDSHAGTQESPIRTLQHARDLARSRSRAMESDLTVHLGAGTYRLSEPFVLEPQDSGTGGHNLVFKGEPGLRPIISGGVQVMAWKLSDAKRNIWSAPAPAALKNTRQLYVDGVRKPRASGRAPIQLTQTENGYRADSDIMAHWRNPGDIEFVYTGGDSIWGERSTGMGGWTEPRCPVAGIEGMTIRMAQPCWNNSTRRVMLPPSIPFNRPANLVGPATFQGKQPAYIENAFELLGTPGQWYFDRSARVIYYVAAPGEDPGKEDVEVPIWESLVSGHGTPKNPLHNIVFSGLQFSYATWLFPSSGEGFSEIQANYLVTGEDGYSAQGLDSLVPNGKEPFGAWTKSAGNVSFSYDRDLQFLNDAFVHLGAAGLDLGNGSQSNLVEGCIFTDVSGCGLELGDVTLPQATDAEATRDNRILNNHIYNIGAEFHGAIGIVVGYAQRTTIQYNQIDHVPYSGISIGWGGWLDKIHRPGLANVSRDNLIANNHIFNHMLLLSDGGGIYNQGLTGPTLANGEKIIGNVVHDQFGSGHGIYTDNGSGMMTIKSNVFYHPNHDNWAAPRADYRDNKNGKERTPFDVEENYWQGNSYHSQGDQIVKGNHLITELLQAPLDILTNAGIRPGFKALLQETFCKATVPEAPRRVVAVAGISSALVSWNPPIFDGGIPVAYYIVGASDRAEIRITAQDFQRHGYAKLSGLGKGSNYSFTVRAVNQNGESVPSHPSRPITVDARPIQPPGPPQLKSAVAQDGRASICFSAPQNNGGSPVIAYRFGIEPGHREFEFTGRTVLTLDGRHSTYFTVDGIKSGTAYTCGATAVNMAGEGPVATMPLTEARDE
jgi:Fibronectin type III domain/Right handed beta helix region